MGCWTCGPVRVRRCHPPDVAASEASPRSRCHARRLSSRLWEPEPLPRGSTGGRRGRERSHQALLASPRDSARGRGERNLCRCPDRNPCCDPREATNCADGVSRGAHLDFGKVTERPEGAAVAGGSTAGEAPAGERCRGWRSFDVDAPSPRAAARISFDQGVDARARSGHLRRRGRRATKSLKPRPVPCVHPISLAAASGRRSASRILGGAFESRARSAPAEHAAIDAIPRSVGEGASGREPWTSKFAWTALLGSGFPQGSTGSGARPPRSPRRLPQLPCLLTSPRLDPPRLASETRNPPPSFGNDPRSALRPSQYASCRRRFSAQSRGTLGPEPT
jgi:hypothetical protein